MSFRIFEGNVLSAEGWRMCNADECVWVQIPGADVTIQVRSGIPATILPAFVARYNQIVEPVTDADTACWTLTNSVSTSNHPAGVAVDICWNRHPFHVKGTFTAQQMAALRQVQNEFRGCVWWGGDWTDPIDEMHHELNYPEGYIDKVTKQFVLAVDQRLIDLANDLRAGYLGIYVPGATPPPPQPSTQPLSRADGYAVKIIQEGQRRNITPRGIEIALATGLVESNLTIYANAKVPASMNIPHDAVGSDGYSVGIFQQQVRDDGNGWWWGDAATCMNPTSSAGLFYDRLDNLDYNGPNSPGSYAQAVQQSAFPDRYDQRMADAIALYNRLNNTTPGDDMALVPQAQWDAVYQELSKKFPSRSPLRHLDQTQFYPGGLVDTFAGMNLNDDGMEHVQYCIVLASYNHPPTMALLNEVAAGDPNQYPDRADDIKLAQAILNKVAVDKVAKATAVVPSAVAQPQVVVTPDLSGIQQSINNMMAGLHQQAAASAPPATGTTGQRFGTALDALEALKSDLTPAGKATIDALAGVLQTEVGVTA